VEASVHQKPVVSACIDSEIGWPGKFTLALSEIGNWPTHQRFRQSGAGRVAYSKSELKGAINHYFVSPEAGLAERAAFIAAECSFTDGSSGQRTAQFLLSKMGKRAL